MKTYYVIWTYVANFSGVHEVYASSAKEAYERATHGFSKDFRERAMVYVWDRPPAFTHNGVK